MPLIYLQAVERNEDQTAEAIRAFQGHLKVSNSPISLNSKSIMISIENSPQGKFAVNFRYDATTPCRCIVFIGGRDYSSSTGFR